PGSTTRSAPVTVPVTVLLATPGAVSPGAGGLATRSGSTGPPVRSSSRRSTVIGTACVGVAGFSQTDPSVRLKVNRSPCTSCGATPAGRANAGPGSPSNQAPPVTSTPSAPAVNVPPTNASTWTCWIGAVSVAPARPTRSYWFQNCGSSSTSTISTARDGPSGRPVSVSVTGPVLGSTRLVGENALPTSSAIPASWSVIVAPSYASRTSPLVPPTSSIVATAPLGTGDSATVTGSPVYRSSSRSWSVRSSTPDAAGSTSPSNCTTTPTTSARSSVPSASAPASSKSAVVPSRYVSVTVVVCVPAGVVTAIARRVNASNGCAPSAVCTSPDVGMPGSTIRSWSTF